PAVGVVLEERALKPRVERGFRDRDEDEAAERVLAQRLEKRDVPRRADLLLQDPGVGIPRGEEKVEGERGETCRRQERRRPGCLRGGDERGRERRDGKAEPVLPVLVDEAPLPECGHPDRRDRQRREEEDRKEARFGNGRFRLLAPPKPVEGEKND